MSTLALKNLHTSADRLRSLIRAGKPVRITDNGETVATVEPVRPAARETRKPRINAVEWLKKNRPPGPGMPDFDVGEYIRKARAAEE
jgi:antitoxin (DNA-binding transcriptional repressor) of toxin-antitoxin stability system